MLVFPFTLLVLGPIGLTIGKVLTTIMLALFEHVGWLAVGLVAMILPLLISIGAHKAFIPYVISSLGELGYEILYNAITMTTNFGAEVLMHVGLDTVKLEGKYYYPQIKDGDHVKKGQLLKKFDIEKIQGEGYDVVTPIIITNYDIFTVKKAAGGSVKADSAMMSLEK